MRFGTDRGSVSAEFAVALPAALVVLVLGLGALGSGTRQVQLQDAAADAARLAGRGESAGRIAAAVTDAVPGAATSTAHRGDLVCVTATAAAVPAVFGTLSATGCALDGGL